MVVLGVDPGSEITGYGVVEGDSQASPSGYHLLEYGAIRPNRSAPFPQKLLLIFNRISEILERFRPEALALEDIFHAMNARSALRLGHARGAVLLAAARAEVPVYEYSALQIKGSVTGYGRAEKRQVQAMIKLLLNLEALPEPLDAADALAAAVCHINLARFKTLIKPEAGTRSNR